MNFKSGNTLGTPCLEMPSERFKTFFGGGLYSGEVYECISKDTSIISQLFMHLVAKAVTSPQGNSSVLYIVTAGTFDTDLMLSALESFIPHNTPLLMKMDMIKKWMQSIHVLNAFSLDVFVNLILSICDPTSNVTDANASVHPNDVITLSSILMTLQQAPCRLNLIVIDGLSLLLGAYAGYIGSYFFGELGHLLRYTARICNAPILTSCHAIQINDAIKEEAIKYQKLVIREQGSLSSKVVHAKLTTQLKPALGKSWSYTAHTQLRLDELEKFNTDLHERLPSRYSRIIRCVVIQSSRQRIGAYILYCQSNSGIVELEYHVLV